jgi:hypothetical protein
MYERPVLADQHRPNVYPRKSNVQTPAQAGWEKRIEVE